jgi:hypothetical protein
MDLDKYVVKVLSHEEMRIIKKFTLTNKCLYPYKMHDFTPDKYLNMESTHIVLCYPQSIEQNIDSIRNGNEAIIFLSGILDSIFYDPLPWFWAYHTSPNIKDILFNNFSLNIFNNNLHFISSYYKNSNNVSKKIITHFKNIFILTKEIIDIEDVVKYIFTFLFMNLSN